MGYLIERKSRTIFVTACSVRADGKYRDIVIESHPEFAIVRLTGSKQQYPLSWETIYARPGNIMNGIYGSRLQRGNPSNAGSPND
jgi:hypothetical protein